MKKWQMIAGVLLVVVAGVLVGSLGMGFYGRYLAGRFKGDASAKKALILQKLSRKLDLTTAQKRSVEALISGVEPRITAHFEASRGEMDRIMEEGFRDLQKVLSAEQYEKWERLQAKFRKWRNTRYRHGPGPPP